MLCRVGFENPTLENISPSELNSLCGYIYNLSFPCQWLNYKSYRICQITCQQQLQARFITLQKFSCDVFSIGGFTAFDFSGIGESNDNLETNRQFSQLVFFLKLYQTVSGHHGQVGLHAVANVESLKIRPDKGFLKLTCSFLFNSNCLSDKGKFQEGDFSLNKRHFVTFLLLDNLFYFRECPPSSVCQGSSSESYQCPTSICPGRLQFKNPFML